jgi:steroid delta-isomerase-like uncharacterized protein
MAADLDHLVRRWFEEVWNQGREETVDELFAQNAIAHGLGENAPDAVGPEQFKVFMRNIRAALPGIRIEVEDTVTHGDKIATRFILRGTHSGQGKTYAPSGKPVVVSGISFVRFSNGQIAEGWNNWDHYGMLQQMGVAPGADAFL